MTDNLKKAKVIGSLTAALGQGGEPQANFQAHTGLFNQSATLPVDLDFDAMEPEEKAFWRYVRRTGHKENQSIRVDIDQLEATENNSRIIYSESRIQEKIDSLRANGQISPLLVAPHPAVEGRFIVIEGWTRTLAARHLAKEDKKWRQLTAIVKRPDSKRSIFEMSFAANNKHSPTSDIEKAITLSRERQKYADDAQMMATLGIKEDHYNRYLRLGKLTEAIIEQIKKNHEKLTIGFADDILYLTERTSEAATLAFIDRIVSEDLSVRQAHKIRDSFLTENDEKRKAGRERLKANPIMMGKKQIGNWKISKDKVVLEMKGLSKDACDKLVAFAQELFQEK